MPAPWGTSTNLTGSATTEFDRIVAGCSGLATKVTDAALQTTSHCVDGLGRTVSVTEADGNVTQYAFDALGNTTRVTANGQVRAFEYSSLSRMMKACNPESATADCSAAPLAATGLDRYSYDAGGNLLTKTDARNVVTTLSNYDKLNRAQNKAYSRLQATGPPVADSTPAVTYAYDADFKGALTSTSMTGTDGLTYSTAYEHDILGRIRTSTQTTAGTAYKFQCMYLE